MNTWRWINWYKTNLLIGQPLSKFVNGLPNVQRSFSSPVSFIMSLECKGRDFDGGRITSFDESLVVHVALVWWIPRRCCCYCRILLRTMFHSDEYIAALLKPAKDFFFASLQKRKYKNCLLPSKASLDRLLRALCVMIPSQAARSATRASW